MKCIPSELFQALIDGELSEKQHYKVLAHTGACLDCRKHLDRMREAVEQTRTRLILLNPTGISDFPAPPLPVRRRPSPQRRNLFWRPIPVPAGVLLLFLVLFGAALAGLLLRKGIGPTSSAPEPQPRSILTVTAGGVTQEMAVDIQFQDYCPVPNPEIIVFTETNHEKSSI